VGGNVRWSPVRALVQTRVLTVPTVEDIGLGHPDRVVSQGCGPRRPRWSCCLIRTGASSKRGLGLVNEKWAAARSLGPSQMLILFCINLVTLKKVGLRIKLEWLVFCNGWSRCYHGSITWYNTTNFTLFLLDPPFQLKPYLNLTNSNPTKIMKWRKNNRLEWRSYLQGSISLGLPKIGKDPGRPVRLIYGLVKPV
jgi:hypothetical protein